MAERFHLVGVGGAGMSAVAELLLAAGHDVSGSDQHDSATLERLRRLGVRTYLGHDAAHVPAAGSLVVSTAVRETNPELRRARELGLPVLHRSQALARAAEGRDFVAVAGAHGKTSTSAMLAVALRAAGQDPSYAIGGTVLALGTGAHLGGGRAFVAEADESDGSFLNYTPRLALVTNIEPDHLDHHGSEAAFRRAFEEFAGRIVPGGVLVACADDDGALALARAAAGRGVRVLTYGTGPAPLAAHVRLTDVELTATGSTATLLAEHAAVPLRLAVGGAHMLLNAAGAWCAGVELGVDGPAMATALGAFTGTGRRFEDRGTAGGVRVVDDYAHHPTEVAATLRTARLAAGTGRVLVLFQPHLFSRTRTFAAEFAAALAAADEVVVTGVYAAREDRADHPGVEGSVIADAMGRAGHPARFVADRLEAASAVARLARPGDLVLTVGAGDVTELGPVILERLGAGA
ncbi:UDP-N-acetylmuramate--L-alanine ligase [Georgenia muralis]|uniref:UDP-N-acetylmuramate--L-alanine ligase n=1 Tax=Georgenia muralis TaxID=154117 RepID=A0A3N4ZQU7_9MICO|nr:UDP-N-acetylmuramate--L-alanine ligase [Georgenia muralis]RPF27922.1 UDP-N-acetylmuramate--L-alanine ligase [Georgenia muralis]